MKVSQITSFIAVVAASLGVPGALGYHQTVHDTHPFTGENASANMVERPDGEGLSMRLQHAPAETNKYSAFVDTRMVIDGQEEVFSIFEFLWDSYMPSFDQFGLDSFSSKGHSKYERQAKRGGKSHGHKLQAIQKDLRTTDGTVMFGTLFFGSQFQELDLILDTGSDWLSIEGADCSNCLGSTYDSSESSTSRRMTRDVSKRTYGNVEF